MKTLIFGLLLASSAAFGSTSEPSGFGGVEMRVNEYTCSQYKSAINRYGKIVVKYSFAARAFFADPNDCPFTDYPVGRHIPAKDGSCYLRWACEYDNRDND